MDGAATLHVLLSREVSESPIGGVLDRSGSRGKRVLLLNAGVRDVSGLEERCCAGLGL